MGHWNHQIARRVAGATLVCLVLCLAVSSSIAMAAPPMRVYQVDDSQSFVDLHVTVHRLGQDFDLQPQSPGSLHASLSGLIRLTFDSPNSFTMPWPADRNDLVVTLSQQPGLFEPGGVTANMAGYADLSAAEPGTRVDFLVTDAAFTLKSLIGFPTNPPIAIDPAGNFAADTLSAEMIFPSALRIRDPRHDANLGISAINIDLNTGAQGSLTELSGQSRFDIPLDTKPINVNLSFGDADLYYTISLSGRMVAFAAVPEPSSWLLALFGMGLVVLARIRNRA